MLFQARRLKDGKLFGLIRAFWKEEQSRVGTLHFLMVETDQNEVKYASEFDSSGYWWALNKAGNFPG